MKMPKEFQREIYCCNCGEVVIARLTNGAEIYPNRKDLDVIPLWKHDKCGGYVGCHKNSSSPTKPLGVIPSKEIREYRKKIHQVIDPLWKDKERPKSVRRTIYRNLSAYLGYEYHTAELSSVDTCKRILDYVSDLENQKLLLKRIK